jgi:hypothetical protein
MTSVTERAPRNDRIDGPPPALGPRPAGLRRRLREPLAAGLPPRAGALPARRRRDRDGDPARLGRALDRGRTARASHRVSDAAPRGRRAHGRDRLLVRCAHRLRPPFIVAVVGTLNPERGRWACSCRSSRRCLAQAAADRAHGTVRTLQRGRSAGRRGRRPLCGRARPARADHAHRREAGAAGDVRALRRARPRCGTHLLPPAARAGAGGTRARGASGQVAPDRLHARGPFSPTFGGDSSCTDARLVVVRALPAFQSLRNDLSSGAACSRRCPIWWRCATRSG